MAQFFEAWLHAPSFSNTATALELTIQFWGGIRVQVGIFRIRPNQRTSIDIGTHAMPLRTNSLKLRVFKAHRIYNPEISSQDRVTPQEDQDEENADDY